MLSSLLVCSVLVIPLLSQAPPGYDFTWEGRQYHVGGESGHSWLDARDICQARGGGWDLATVTSEQENDGVEVGSLEYLVLEQGEVASGCFFLGGFNIVSSTGMDWVTGETADYFHWSPNYGEPNDYPGSCVYMCVKNYAGMSGFWSDKSCSVTGSTKYICEKHF